MPHNLNQRTQNITKSQLISVESKYHLKFPEELKKLFLHHNGSALPPLFRNGNLEIADLDVQTTLPLLKQKDSISDGCVDVYEELILKQAILPSKFFPFAVDSGGDYFFVDCHTKDGAVYVYRHDTESSDPNHLLKLSNNLSEFWTCLVEE